MSDGLLAGIAEPRDWHHAFLSQFEPGRLLFQPFSREKTETRIIQGIHRHCGQLRGGPRRS
jgi:hypothetical protein